MLNIGFYPGPEAVEAFKPSGAKIQGTMRELQFSFLKKHTICFCVRQTGYSAMNRNPG